MKNTGKRFSISIVGGASLLVIFAVLCLTVFTLLSISTASANARLSEVSADSVSAYYDAEGRANEIFARLRAGEIPDSVTVNGDLYSYSVEITPTLTLYVELSVSNGEWTVLRWQTVSSNL